MLIKDMLLKEEIKLLKEELPLLKEKITPVDIENWYKQIKDGMDAVVFNKCGDEIEDHKTRLEYIKFGMELIGQFTKKQEMVVTQQYNIPSEEQLKALGNLVDKVNKWRNECKLSSIQMGKVIDVEL